MTFNNSNPFTANGQPLVAGNAATAAFGGSTPSFQATMRAMESAGVVRTLAEPNLTAISGKSATFIAGGKFQIPTGVTCQTTAAGSVGQCAPSIAFKKFGISLDLAVVLTEGRISLRVMTEVSEVSNANSISISGISVPSIKTRRAETTLEIPSGGAMAMAGLIQDQTKQAINGLPGLAQLPVLGTLFRSRDFVNNQTELMVLVTPSSFALSHRRICRVRMTALHPSPTRRPICGAASIASTAFRAAPSRRGIIAAPTALSPTKAG